MTDEELAEEEYKKCKFEKIEHYCDKAIYVTGFLAGLKAGRPQWHDIRENPKDLPKEPKRYLCQIECCVGSAITYECSDYDVEYNSWRDSYGDVIAWCEIPTFNKE